MKTYTSLSLVALSSRRRAPDMHFLINLPARLRATFPTYDPSRSSRIRFATRPGFQAVSGDQRDQLGNGRD